MYSPLNTKAGSLKTGAATMAGIVGQFPTETTNNGLTVDPGFTLPGTVVMTTRLHDWLVKLRLLCNIPLSYLVPDSALLPAESIRFFNVDPTWVDRLIDGVFSAANTGTVDIAYSVGLLEMVREALDASLIEAAQALIPTSSWTPAQGITGMLIRSDLARRWPDMVVRAFSGTTETDAQEMPVLRAEPISKDVYIALFAGTPQLVELREPHVGVRFGLDTLDQVHFTYVLRAPGDGKASAAPAQKVTLAPMRVVPVRTIATTPTPPAAALPTPRTVAIQLMRQPYVQQFISTVPETRGSQNPPPSFTFQSGRVMNVADLQTRLATMQRLGKS